MTKDESREIVYGMPYERMEGEAPERTLRREQKAAFEKASHKH